MQREEIEQESVNNKDTQQVLDINDVINNFLNYIYRFRIKFINAIISYLNLYRDSFSEKKLVKNYLKIWLIDYDKYLTTKYFENNMPGVSEELKDKLVDFIDLLCSPEFMQIYIKKVFEEYKVFTPFNI